MEYPFPDGEGSDGFLNTFKTAVTPDKWEESLRKEIWPLVLLETGGVGQAAADRARRVLDGLELTLGHAENKRVAYARPQLPADLTDEKSGTTYLTYEVGELLKSGTPPENGRLRLRQLRLMTDLVRWARALPHDRLPGERELRDHVYDLRAHDPAGGLPHTLARLSRRQQAPVFPGEQSSPDAQSAVELLWQSVAGPLFHTFPRWCWAASWTRRLVRSKKRGWYGNWRPIDKKSSRFFDKSAEFLLRQTVRLREGHASAENAALGDFEEMLMRALLADLDRARSGRLHPWRRRRRARRVVLLHLPPAGTPAGRVTQRFLDAYLRAAHTPGSTSLLLVGAGQASGYVTEDRRQEYENLQQLVRNLAPVTAAGTTDGTADGTAPKPVLCSMPAQRFDAEGMHTVPFVPPGPAPKPATELTCELAAVVLVLGLVGNYLWPHVFPPPPDCLHGTTVTAGRADPRPVGSGTEQEGTPRQQYDAVVKAIGKLNDKARYAEKTHHKPVRKVVYLGSSVDSDPEQVVMNGVIPELRGIWLAQEKLNELAAQDPNRVRLYVDVQDTGRQFKHVVGHARSVVAEARRNRDRQDSTTLVGVIGFRESRAVTKKAATVLSNGKVPVIGTTATADAMQKAGDYYRPMSPDNSRETAVAAQFAHDGHIIETKPGQCGTAARALVVKDPDDLYSNELGSEFVRNFKGATETWNFPGGDGAVVSGQDTAEWVCGRARKSPRTVVYWASRVDNFTQFVNAYGPDSGCSGVRLTVIGSNELTNAALGGQYLDQPWLRLYHTVHVLPDGHRDENQQAEDFIMRYIREYTARDPWINDGHVALAHDALRVLGLAADEEYTSNHAVDAEGVKSKLDDGIHFEGVSGDIDIPRRNGSNPPRNKALVMLEHTGDGQKLVLYCGAFRQAGGPVDHWGPHLQYKCPQDEN